MTGIRLYANPGEQEWLLNEFRDALTKGRNPYEAWMFLAGKLLSKKPAAGHQSKLEALCDLGEMLLARMLSRAT